MKKTFATILTLILVVSMFSGCGSKKEDAKVNKEPEKEVAKEESKETGKETSEEASNKEKVHLRMVYWNKEETVKPFLDLVKEKLPEIDLEFQFIDLQNFGILTTQLEAGEGPDILCTATDEAQIRAGHYLDLTDTDFINRYSDASIKSISVDGRVYGVPGISWFEGMFYNKKIFKEYGLEIPKTFDELQNIHKVLSENGVSPQAMGAKSWEPMFKSTLGLAMCDWLMKTEDGKTFDIGIQKGERTFAGSELKNVIEKWSLYIDNGYINEDMLGVDYDQALNLFATEKAAMWESGPWSVNALKEKNPDLEFDMFPFVGTEEAPGWLIGGPGVIFGVNANSEHSDEALKVIELMSTDEGQLALWKGAGAGSSFLKGVEFPLPEEYAGVQEAFNNNNVYCPWFVWKGDGTYIETYGKGLQEYLSGSKTVDEVLESVDKKVKEIQELKK